METPKNKAGDITEKIMMSISQYIDREKYNSIYSTIYTILESEGIGLVTAGSKDIVKYLQQKGIQKQELMNIIKKL